MQYQISQELKAKWNKMKDRLQEVEEKFSDKKNSKDYRASIKF